MISFNNSFLGASVEYFCSSGAPRWIITGNALEPEFVWRCLCVCLSWLQNHVWKIGLQLKVIKKNFVVNLNNFFF